jgi:hypothetical protein
MKIFIYLSFSISQDVNSSARCSLKALRQGRKNAMLPLLSPSSVELCLLPTLSEAFRGHLRFGALLLLRTQAGRACIARGNVHDMQAAIFLVASSHSQYTKKGTSKMNAAWNLQLTHDWPCPQPTYGTSLEQ